MKTKSALLRSLGALALFVLVAFPSSSALATGPCADPDIYYEYEGPTGIRVYMYSAPPHGATVFFTLNWSNPTHTGATPGANTMIYYGPISVPSNSWMHFKALAWKQNYLDSGIVQVSVSNPPQ